MGSGEGNPHWTVFEGVKTIPSTPESLMAEINSAIANLESARASALLDPPSPSSSSVSSSASSSPSRNKISSSASSSPSRNKSSSSASSSPTRNKGSDATGTNQYDAQAADEAYRAGCAALAAGKLDEGLQSLNLSLAKCPPDCTFAVTKLQSLISLTSQQLQKSSQR